MELSPVQKVFCLPELVSLILEYSASGQKRNDILRLRTVCHLWRRMAFKTLVINKIVADVYLRINSGFSYFDDSFQPKCFFPIDLLITKKDLSKTDIDFIQSYAHNFVTVKIIDADACKETYPIDPLTVELPHLKTLDVRIPHWARNSEDNLVHQLIANLAENGTRLETFQLRLFLREGDTISSSVLKKVTRLSVGFSSFSSLSQVFLENNLPKLTRLQMSTELKTEPDTDVITKILKRLSGQLKSFVFASWNLHYNCNLEKMEELEELVTSGLQIDTKNKLLPFSAVVPKLVKLRVSVNGSLKHYHNLLTRNWCKFEILEKLVFTRDLKDTGENFVNQLIQINSRIPRLKHLSLPTLSAPVAEVVLPVIFSRFTHLTGLSISISHSFYRGGDYEIGRMLTGVDAAFGFEPRHIDKDSPLWPTFLAGKQDSITNMTNLKELTLDVDRYEDDEVYCKLPRFLFRAGFFQMPNLAELNLYNCKLNPGLYENYVTETGRKISQSNRFYGEELEHHELNYYDTSSWCW